MISVDTDIDYEFGEYVVWLVLDGLYEAPLWKFRCPVLAERAASYVVRAAYRGVQA